MQLRFCDGDAERWAARVARLRGSDTTAHRRRDPLGPRGAAPTQMPTSSTAAAGRPLHAHVSEQPAENDACLAAYGATPTQLLADARRCSAR